MKLRTENGRFGKSTPGYCTHFLTLSSSFCEIQGKLLDDTPQMARKSLISPPYRTFESTALKLLLEWASTSVELSINAPTLPHAIIVLNDSKTRIDEEEWDSSIATRNLMDHVANAIYDVVSSPRGMYPSCECRHISMCFHRMQKRH